MSLNSIFSSVLTDSTSLNLSVATFLLCMGTSLILGLLIAVLYRYKTHSSKSFLITLTTLPAVVAMVIMMVNGNIGTGVAVAGAFSLVRFRSVPGTAKEIGAIFLAMGAGLSIGMGYLGFATLFTLTVSLISLLLTATPFGESHAAQRTLTITIPENLDYCGVFDDLFVNYTTNFTLDRVKTTNMGSLLKLTYTITLADTSKEKQFIDDIRCRNGNLEIVLSRLAAVTTEL